jgi:hypothetical protein
MSVHDGPGVVPGRYSSGPIVLHEGPTPQQTERAAERAAADALAGRLCAAAAVAARSEYALLDLVGEFDASGAVRFWTDVKSVAHWLGWACSMTPGVAREHVRVARALRRMPAVRTAFADGRLSYSKVREVTRVVDVVDDTQLVDLALTATASQLARTVRGFRAADGTRLHQQAKRSLTWHTRDDGMVEVRAVLPPEEGAVVVAALTAAQDQFGAPPEKPELGQTSAAETAATATAAAPAYGQADALLDVAQTFLDIAPEDRSGEDRRLVVVHVSTDQLSGSRGDVPAGTLSDPRPAEVHDDPADPTCHVEGVGPIEPETARRLACDADLLGAVVDAHGDVLALGRTRRLVSRAQRRALMIRDGMCQFPGCHQTRHLDAHHRTSWAEGGATDLENLVLLCQWHHTAVHEGGMGIQRTPGARVQWRFVMPDGTPHRPWWDADTLGRLLAERAPRGMDEREAGERGVHDVTSFDDPAAQTIRPRWAGEAFDLHACVEALFTMRLPEDRQEAA